MRVKKILSRIILVILILGIVAGAVWVLDWLAVIDVRKTAGKIPVVGKMISAEEVKDDKKDDKKDGKEAPPNPLEEENKKLKEQVQRLEKQAGEMAKQLEIVNTEKQDLLEERETLQGTLASMKSLQEQQEGAEVSYQKLAEYYTEMKPEAAVNIMNNLADDVTIGILQYLDNEQTAKILSAMEPEKAAGIVDQMKQ
ncbi:MotE family protein [Phosphitispora fastidiosa]|uniref:MotE family protein n=1 Tax=Phosphitispora fastidiosa TaxID=2837202 RepID=UPI001E49563E|nr:flagellar motility protein MotE (MotC chaperone) [Phosphitispora fastidiosa]